MQRLAMGHALLCVAALALVVAAPPAASQDAAAGEAPPAVKMSRARVCHPLGTPGYAQTQRYEAFESVQACLAAGGRLARGVVAPEDAPAPPADLAVFDTEDASFVRRSRAGICYTAADGGYLQLLYFKAYRSLEDCLASGGRRAGNDGR
jgi:hypothetical protein